MSDSRYAHRESILGKATEYVTQQRNKSYGEPDEDFQRIAAIASAMGFRVAFASVQEGMPSTRELTGSDVSKFMIALKLARLNWSPDHEDSWADIIGYGACGYEVAMLEKARREDVAGMQVGLLVPPEDAAKMAAFQAINGDPSTMEALGLFLSENENECRNFCGRTHRFHSECKYRIRKRRED